MGRLENNSSKSTCFEELSTRSSPLCIMYCVAIISSHPYHLDLQYTEAHVFSGYYLLSCRYVEICNPTFQKVNVTLTGVKRPANINSV